VDFLQAKLSDESSRRARAEERSRVLKNYSEKAKVGKVGVIAQCSVICAPGNGPLFSWSYAYSILIFYTNVVWKIMGFFGGSSHILMIEPLLGA
jgi:hypothetical protein